jgi:hypothetical protein
MHDHAWRSKARRDHDHFVYARLLPHTAKDSRRVPHSHEALASSIHDFIVLATIQLGCDSTRYSPVISFKIRYLN